MCLGHVSDSPPLDPGDRFPMEMLQHAIRAAQHRSFDQTDAVMNDGLKADRATVRDDRETPHILQMLRDIKAESRCCPIRNPGCD
jgi:hypothetical protein